VLISGGGPVGLAAALELGQRGISCVVVEPRVTVSHARPRCKTLNVRTMEHLRRWGIADRLRAVAPLRPEWSQDVVFCTSMVGRELSRFTGVFGLTPDGARFAELGQQAPQYVLEEVLRDAVDELPSCRMALGARVVGLEQHEGAVSVTVADADGERLIEAAYVLGCDGSRSAVRAAIGARYVGDVALRPNFGTVFRAPGLAPRVRHGRAIHYWIINERAPGVLGPLDQSDTWWAIFLGIDRHRGEQEVDQLIAAAVGEDVDAEVLSTDPWTAHMQLVDHSRQGRVFIAGDAAHLNPPWGGHGLNTGIGDAVDLGWKLAAVLDGWGGPGLLDSYEQERRPVQARIITEAAANMSVLSSELIAEQIDHGGAVGEVARQRIHERIQRTKGSEFHSLDLVLGAGYEQSCVVADDVRPGDRSASSARPGFRLPHSWIAPGRSIYDMLGPALTLLRLQDAAPDALVAACRARGVALTVLDLRHQAGGPGYGAGLVLVRPDQHVAWVADAPPADAGGLIDQICGHRATS
jgi:2-polyprenyl-6-methoxyphenol hydroxylase-like FAD-dependent oxidoreductase